MATTNTCNLKQISEPVLSDTNYVFFSIKMNMSLQLNKCWDMVETEFKEPDTNALAVMNNSEKNALESHWDQDLTTKWPIQSCIKESIFPHILGDTSAHQPCNMLVPTYKGRDWVKMVRLQTLRLQFESLKMKENEIVDEFMTSASGIVTQFQTYGEHLEHKVVA